MLNLKLIHRPGAGTLSADSISYQLLGLPSNATNDRKVLDILDSFFLSFLSSIWKGTRNTRWNTRFKWKCINRSIVSVSTLQELFYLLFFNFWKSSWATLLVKIEIISLWPVFRLILDPQLRPARDNNPFPGLTDKLDSGHQNTEEEIVSDRW